MAVSAKKTSVKWSEEMKELFIDCMRTEVARGNFTDSGFKTRSWNRIHEDFNASSSVKVTKVQMQSQYGDMKVKYTVFAALVANRRFGWDPDRKIPTAPDYVWAAYLESHPEVARYRHNTLPFYDKLQEIFGGKVATGQLAAASNADNSSDSDSEGEGDREFHLHVSAIGVPPVSPVTPGNCLSASASSSTRKRKASSLLEEATTLLAEVLQGMPEHPAVAVLKLMNEKYIPELKLTPNQAIQLKMKLNKEDAARLFLYSSEEEREVYLEQLINNE